MGLKAGLTESHRDHAGCAFAGRHAWVDCPLLTQLSGRLPYGSLISFGSFTPISAAICQSGTPCALRVVTKYERSPCEVRLPICSFWLTSRSLCVNACLYRGNAPHLPGKYQGDCGYRCWCQFL